MINNYQAPAEFHPQPSFNFWEPAQTFNQDDADYEDDESFGQDAKRGSFEFPDGGWECHKCQNYNFKGRKECYRCKKPKSVEDIEGKPEHMLKPEKQVNKKKSKIMKKQIMERIAAQSNDENSSVAFNSKAESASKRPAERVGDWTCQRCFNHNFSFREVCNMCQLSHADSMNMLAYT